VVEGPPFWRLRGHGCDQVLGVRDVDVFLAVEDLVAVAGDRVDVVETVCSPVSAPSSLLQREDASHTPHAQLLQGIDAARLQQLAHYPIRLLQALLQQNDAPALLAECNSCRAANDAGAHNDDVGFMVYAPPLFATV
jgi:hypothetical protein